MGGLKFSACIEMLYTEAPFLERIDRAARSGFQAVEFWNWDNKDLPAIRQKATACGVEIAVFQGNMGGTLIDAHDRARLVTGISNSLTKAQEAGVGRVILLTDELGSDRSVKPLPHQLTAEEKRANVLAGLKELTSLAEQAGVILLLEPLNSLVDHKGYYLDHSIPGFELVREVGSRNLRLLYDIYHMQVMEGNILATLKQNIDLIGHIHVADVPGRHQPGTGELNYRNILWQLEDLGYGGYIGFEFEPIGLSEDIMSAVFAMLK